MNSSRTGRKQEAAGFLEPLAECEAADQRNQEQYNEYEEQYLGDPGCGDSDSTEAEDGRDDSNYQEYGRPAQHKTSIGSRT
jgi:hypothetical protein